jgi:hypothetical protein
MSYRDDLQAMAARVSALESQLAEAEQGQDSERGRAERLEASLRDSRAELERLRAKLPPEPVAVSTKGNRGVVVAGVLFLIAGGLVVGFASHKKHTPLNPQCTLSSIPMGARLFVVRGLTGEAETDVLVGTTPLTLTRDEWIMHGAIGNVKRFELRAEGHETAVVTSPLSGMGCAPVLDAIRLRPLP